MKIEKLIKDGESETVEFKQGFGRDAIETAVAWDVKQKIFYQATDNSDIIRT